jgi:hypothetical protein
MVDYEDEASAEAPSPAPAAPEPQDRQPDQAEMDLVSTLCKRIKDDKKNCAKAFKQMRRDMKIARLGADPKQWDVEKQYTANIVGRHINQSVAALYAKNPKAIARRRPRLDFKVWDETEESLLMAMQVSQQAMMLAQPDPMTGMPMLPADPMVAQAMAVMQDYQRGMERRMMVDKIGKTLEILFDYYTKEQTPVDFKTSMKQLVRRAKTTGVGYIKLGFQREVDEDPQVTERLADFKEQLRHIQLLSEQSQDTTNPDREERQRELELAVKSLQEQQFILLREGLVFDFPDSTRVIPDTMGCRSLVGFVGARWLSVEYLYTPDEVKKIFGRDVKKGYKAYSNDGTSRDADQMELNLRGDEPESRDDLVCVWEHFDRQTGTVYYLADGYRGFLREPGKPEVYVEDFWPVFALTFNEVEDCDNIFPPSDVALMAHMQAEWNRARQGKREHRKAARPRFVSRQGFLSDEDKVKLATAKAFDVVELNVPSEVDLAQVMQPIAMPGVDPNLYDLGEIMQDIQIVVGSQEAQFGAVSKATATEASIAAGSQVASTDSNVDDLDAFLVRIARASGKIMLKELSPETVIEIAGEGAIWPQLTLDEIAKEVFLEIEAGSSGKPNQAQELQNWERMLPFLIQIGSIQPTWLARETLRRLDDRMDLTDAIADGLPSILSMSRMAQPAPADPGAAPDQQGEAGANNAPAPPGGPAGTGPAFGSNQV